MKKELKNKDIKKYPIKHNKLNDLGIYSSEDFLVQSSTYYRRLILSYKIGKSLVKINKLTAYFDLLRLSSMSPQLADFLLEYGVKGIGDLRKYDAKTLFQGLVFRFPRVSDMSTEHEIYLLIAFAKQFKRTVFDLDSDCFEIQNGSYASQKNKQENLYLYTQNLSKKESISFFIQCFVIVCLSIISWYFVVFIPVLFLFHFYKNSYFLSSFHYNIRLSLENIISDEDLPEKHIFSYIQRYFIEIKKIMSIVGILFFLGIFFIGLRNQSIILSITDSFPGSIDKISTQKGPRSISQDIYSRYEGKNITRAELIGILFYSQKKDISTLGYTECFADIAESVYASQICYAKAQGYVSGDSDNNFNPDTIVSHAAGLKFILNFSKIDVPNSTVYVSYEDLKKGEWLTSYAEYAKKNNIIDPSVKIFGPQKPLTIDQVDEYLYRIKK